MEFSTLVERLEVVGLSRDEAEVYVRLLQSGPSKAGALAPTVSVSRTKLYRVLDDLAHRSAVKKSLQRPTIYQPRPPETLIDAQLEKLHRVETRVRGAREDLVDDLHKITEAPVEDPVDHWNLVEGRAGIHATLQALLEEARRSIWYATNHGASGSSLPEVEQTGVLLARRAADGVSVRSLAAAPGGTLEPLDRDLGDVPIERRVLDVDEPLRLALIDGNELLLWVRNETPGASGLEAVALHTDAPSVVDANRMFFERLWSSTQPAEP